MLSIVIVMNIARVFCSPTNGLFNIIIQKFGGESINFFGEPQYVFWIYWISGIWQSMGYSAVLYISALSGIDMEQLEAAKIDGANRFQQMLYVTLPGIAGMMATNLILSCGHVMDAGFDQVFNMYAPIVYETGDIIDTYVYRLGIAQAQYSIGTAVGLFKSVASSILVGISYILADKLAGYRIF